MYLGKIWPEPCSLGHSWPEWDILECSMVPSLSQHLHFLPQSMIQLGCSRDEVTVLTGDPTAHSRSQHGCSWGLRIFNSVFQ